jgi:hypothetical protein
MHAPSGIRTLNPSKRGPQTRTLDRAATGIGNDDDDDDDDICNFHIGAIRNRQ